MNEEWRPVPGWESVYQVSSEGRVKNITRDVRSPWGFRKVEGRLMSLLANGNGYRFLYLKRGNTRTKAYVHRLVALAFITQPAGECVVNHKDFNPANNTAANLEWVSQAENLNYSRKAGRMPVTDKQRAAGASARLIAQQRRNTQ